MCDQAVWDRLDEIIIELKGIREALSKSPKEQFEENVAVFDELLNDNDEDGET